MSDDLASASALELAELIRTKRVSPVEVVTATLARLERLEPSLNAFVTVTPELALEDARRAEATLMVGGDLPPLLGVPVSVKDLIAVKDVRATFGSRTLAGAVAGVDAPAVERLRTSGACIIGKTTTSEFGCKPVGDSPAHGNHAQSLAPREDARRLELWCGCQRGRRGYALRAGDGRWRVDPHSRRPDRAGRD